MSQDLIQKIISEKANGPWWLESEKKVTGKYGQMFNPVNLDRLTKENFKSFLLIENNLHWEGIHRQGNIITADMAKLIKFLKHALNEDISTEERLNTDFIEEGGLWVKGVGRAVITPILLVVYPNKYGVWNTKSEEGLRKLNLYPKFERKDKFGNRYKKVNLILNELSEKYKISLWQLDGVLGDLVGSSPLEFGKDQEEELEEEMREHGIDDPGVFGMEKHLEDFMIANWDKTIFGGKYNLIYKEGDLLSQQYSTPIGLIDILARSKDGKEYLIIELKKGRSSDAVVGQILRYIAWVRENLAKDKEVKGVVVVLDMDEKLKYALRELKNISLYTYQVDFKLIMEGLS